MADGTTTTPTTTTTISAGAAASERVITTTIDSSNQDAGPAAAEEEDLRSAAKLVRALWEQITANDAPAVNEQQLPCCTCTSTTSITVGGAAVAAEQYNNNSHNNDKQSPSSPASGPTTTSSFETIETATSAIFHSSLRQEEEEQEQRQRQQSASNNNSEHSSGTLKMGHAALAQLCRNSLEKYDVLPHQEPSSSSLEPNSSNSTTTNDCILNTPITAVLQEQPPVSSNRQTTLEIFQQQQQQQQTSSVGDATAKPPARRARSKFRHMLTRHKMTNNNNNNNTMVRRWNVDDGSFPPSREDADEEEKKQDDDRNDPPASFSQQPQQTAAAAAPRLQLFGSEYARFLSNSQLAPAPASTRAGQSAAAAAAAASVVVNGNSSNDYKKHSSRPPMGHPSRSSAAAAASHGSSSHVQPRPPLEEAPPEIQTGAILDIIVCVSDLDGAAATTTAQGYHRVSRTATGRPFQLVPSNPKCHLYVKKEAVWDKAAQRPTVTAVTLIFPDRGEFVPPGFTVVRVAAASPNHPKSKGIASSSGSSNANNNSNSSAPANLNGSGRERAYLCFRRSREGNPITDLVPLLPPEEAVPTGYTVIEHTPRHHVAHWGGSNNSHGSKHSKDRPTLFLAYRQRLASLETLRPPPLVQTVVDQQQRQRHGATTTTTTGSAAQKSNGCRNARRAVTLKSYYATGGTTVQSDIGRFHILDRTTHSLLSPSSVANRLSLIEWSRQARSSPSVDGSETSRHNNNSNSSYYHHYATQYARSDHSDNVSQASSADGSGSSRMRHPRGWPMANVVREREPATADRLSQHSLGHDPLPQDHDDPSLLGSTANLSSLLAPALPPENDDDGTSTSISKTSLDPVISAEDGDVIEQREALSFIPEVEAAVLGASSSRLEDRVALLTPILTACYTRHGGAALIAVEGLTKLLTETTFFDDDADRSDENENESSTRITLLDLAIQSVCDVATNSALDTTFASCVEFVERAVRFSQGQLNTRTVGFVMRFYMFVFYFDASIPMRKRMVWPAKAWRPLSMQNEEDFPMLFDPREDDSGFSRGYLPGGAPQGAALALKELISLSIVRLGKVSVTDLLMLSQTSPVNNKDASPSNDVYASLLDGILSSVVDNAVDHVERANYTQLALHQIHRSGGSELFWHDMVHACGSGLFNKDPQLGEAGKDIYVMIFAMLEQLVKVASGKLRSGGHSADVLLPKDLASKLLALELLLHFLEFWSDEQEAVSCWAKLESTEATRSIETLSFVVRRTVVPCLLGNTQAVVSNPQVFRRVIRILSELWCSPVYRQHCKVELGILVEHFGLRILEMGPQCKHLHDKHCMLAQQVELLAEIKNWFSNDPKDVIEMYLNYDTDISSEITGAIQLLPGTRWQIFQRLCAGLSNIAEQCGELIGDQIRHNQSLMLTQESSGTESGESRLKAEKKSAVDNTIVREAARVLRRSSVETIAQIVKALALSAGASLGKEFIDLLLSWTPVESPIAYEMTPALLSDEPSEPTNKEGPEDELKKGVLDFWRKLISEEQRERFSATNPSRDESLDVAFDIARQKSLKKAIEYLIACNTLTPSPRDIANFLRIYKERLDPVDLGLYLSESGVSGAETEYWTSIRYLFVRPISFIGMTVEEGLRHFLTSSGFRLPGEAQRIDRVVDTFSQCYFEDNAGDIQRCPFKDQDTVYLLVFAIIMLNTDLHKSDSKSRKANKKMTKAEFSNNLKGATTLHEALSKDYLSDIYDSIRLNPIAIHDEPDSASFAESPQSKLVDEMLKSVRGSDSLLRGLAVHDFHFASIDDFTNTLAYSAKDALSDLTCSCVSKTWYQWHGVVNTCLETAHLDPQGMESAIEILLYALVVTICLQMPMERNAFLSQLVRFKTFEERRQGRWSSAADQSHREEQWYLELDSACSGPPASKLNALKKIYNLIQSLKDALRVDARSKVEMTAAVGELINGDFLLLDPARSFLQSGNLIKKSSRTGRVTEYKFYLFSDVLLYASEGDGGRYKIHEELPLHLMKIVDWFPPSQKNRQIMFEVHHPRKTFRVLCPSPAIRKEWVEQIRASILTELEHKMTVENARLSEVVARRTSVAG